MHYLPGSAQHAGACSRLRGLTAGNDPAPGRPSPNRAAHRAGSPQAGLRPASGRPRRATFQPSDSAYTGLVWRHTQNGVRLPRRKKPRRRKKPPRGKKPSHCLRPPRHIAAWFGMKCPSCGRETVKSARLRAKNRRPTRGATRKLGSGPSREHPRAPNGTQERIISHKRTRRARPAQAPGALKPR
jgi:hypothetical protein